MKKILIFGTGAQAKYALETFSFDPEIEIAALVDINGNQGNVKTLYGYPLISDMSQVDGFGPVEGALVCCANPRQKEEIQNRLERQQFTLVNAIHPNATIAKTAQIGKGIIINPGAVIQPFAEVGNGVMIHANVIIEHDNKIMDYVNLGPGASLAGWVTAKQCATLYTGAVVIPKITIGKNAIVGAGAVIIRDVPDNAVVVGVPGKVIKFQEEEK